MSHHDHGPDTYHNLSPVGKIICWTVMFLVFVPMFGFFAGMGVSVFLPASAYLTSPALCSNRNLQIQQVDKPSKAWGTSFTIYDYCVDSHTRKISDVSDPAHWVVALIVAVVITVIVGLFVILVVTIRFLLGGQSTS